MKRVVLPTIIDAARTVATYAPIGFTVIGADDEEDFVAALQAVLDVAATMPLGAQHRCEASSAMTEKENCL